MQSRRDLFQAHRLMTRRAALALLRGEPDVPDQPLRRLNVAAFSGILVAAIVTVLFFMWGLLGHSGSPLQDQPGTLVIDKNTGTPYVFCEGRKLCPVLNYASARLALKSASLNQQTVSPSAIAKFPQGPEIGIQGLPPLPDPGQLVRQPWSVCTQVTTTVVGNRTVTALSGGIPTGGQPLGTRALLVQALDQDWVVWDARRMPIQPAFISALHTSQTTPATVPPVWLNALPQGPAFAPPAIAGRLDRVAGPAGGSALVGQVYAVSAAGSTQYYVLLQQGGVASVTQTQARLLETEPGAPQQSTLTAAQANGHLSKTPVPRGELPSSIPAVTAPAPTVQLCVVYAGSGSSLTWQVETGGNLPRGGVKTGVPGDVDQVALPPEAGALVGAEPGTGPDNAAISYFLVADGRRYALAYTAVAGMLGYSLSQAVLLPAGVVDMIPEGPVLEPGAATNPVPFSG